MPTGTSPPSSIPAFIAGASNYHPLPPPPLPRNANIPVHTMDILQSSPDHVKCQPTTYPNISRRREQNHLPSHWIPAMWDVWMIWLYTHRPRSRIRSPAGWDNLEILSHRYKSLYLLLIDYSLILGDQSGANRTGVEHGEMNITLAGLPWGWRTKATTIATTTVTTTRFTTATAARTMHGSNIRLRETAIITTPTNLQSQEPI